MNLLWLSHFAPFPPKGGALQRSYNLLKETSKYFDVTIILLAPYSKVIAFYDDYNQGLIDIEKELSKFCKCVHIVPFGRLNRKKNRNLNAIKSLFSSSSYDVISLESNRFQSTLDSVIQLNSFDLTHVDTVGLWPYVRNLALPIVLNHHNIESAMLYRRASNSPWPLNVYIKREARKLKVLEREAVRGALLNITCSDLDSDRLRELHNVDSTPVPNGVDLDYFKRKQGYNSDTSQNLIFAGGLGWYPNSDAMLFFAKEVWPLLKKANHKKRFKMYVVGKGKVKVLDELTKVDKDFIVTGFVDDVREYLEKADIYVCPIRDGGGTKLKVLDALAMGVPLIAHPASCEGIKVQNGLNVLLAETAEEFVEKIVELSDDMELRKSLSKQGIKLIESDYCFEQIGRSMAELYKQRLSDKE